MEYALNILTFVRKAIIALMIAQNVQDCLTIAVNLPLYIIKYFHHDLFFLDNLAGYLCTINIHQCVCSTSYNCCKSRIQ